MKIVNDANGVRTQKPQSNDTGILLKFRANVSSIEE